MQQMVTAKYNHDPPSLTHRCVYCLYCSGGIRHTTSFRLSHAAYKLERTILRKYDGVNGKAINTESRLATSKANNHKTASNVTG